MPSTWRFRREVELAVSLDQPDVIRVYDGRDSAAAASASARWSSDANWTHVFGVGYVSQVWSVAQGDWGGHRIPRPDAGVDDRHIAVWLVNRQLPRAAAPP